MGSSAKIHRTAIAAGAIALVSMGVLGACGTEEKPTETPSPSQPTATMPPTPTEKAVAPSPKPGSGAENSFTPSVKATPAPTALPGNVVTGG
jgi:hypothetical protein